MMNGRLRIRSLLGIDESTANLGQVFEGERYPTSTDQRDCINSISLRLMPQR
jgi:peptide methionine sulfoxide reductase MsrB